jgi:hypothetical protein
LGERAETTIALRSSLSVIAPSLTVAAIRSTVSDRRKAASSNAGAASHGARRIPAIIASARVLFWRAR